MRAICEGDAQVKSRVGRYSGKVYRCKWKDSAAHERARHSNSPWKASRYQGVTVLEATG